jgi:hypothetical protein
MDRGHLEALLGGYLDALVARAPERLRASGGCRFTENGVELELGDGLWATASGLGTYRHCVLDPEAGQAGFVGVVQEQGVDHIMALRLGAADGLVTEVETVVIRDPRGAGQYERLGDPDPRWRATTPPAQRLPREHLVALADAYWSGMERNDGRGVYPFADACERTENGTHTTNRPSPAPYGHWEIEDFVTRGARAQLELGFFRFVSRVRARRFPVVDEARSVVLSFALLDHGGTADSVRLTDGRVLAYPSYFLTPRTLLAAEAFKVEKGLLRLIEANLTEVPYGMAAGWA